MSGLVEVATFQSIEEARVVIGYLQANGVEARLADAHIQSLFGAGLLSGKCRVMAPVDQIDAARQLLDEAAAGHSTLAMEESDDREA